jgi:hypothetical protein
MSGEDGCRKPDSRAYHHIYLASYPCSTTKTSLTDHRVRIALAYKGSCIVKRDSGTTENIGIHMLLTAIRVSGAATDRKNLGKLCAAMQRAGNLTTTLATGRSVFGRIRIGQLKCSYIAAAWREHATIWTEELHLCFVRHL